MLFDLLFKIKNNIITSLNLSNCNIRDLAVRYIFDALKENVSVTIVDLSNKNNFCNLNRISSEGVSFIAEALKINKTITIIDLSGNLIGVKGVNFLANTLEKNDTLISLKLDKIGVFTYKDDYIYGNKYMLECDKSLDYKRSQSLFASITSKLERNRINSDNKKYPTPPLDR